MGLLDIYSKRNPEVYEMARYLSADMTGRKSDFSNQVRDYFSKSAAPIVQQQPTQSPQMGIAGTVTKIFQSAGGK